MRKVKIRKSFATNIIFIFLIFNIISILFFTYYIKSKEDNNNIQYAKSSLQEIVDEKSKLISISFDRIETHVNLLQTWIERMFENKTIVDSLPDKYKITDDGMIIKTKDASLRDEEQSCIIVPNTEEKTRELFSEINLTEQLDKPFEKIIEKEDVTWAYIVTKHNLLRCSPYYDVTIAFDSDHNQRNDIFYTEADEENNPTRKAIWTKPYTDYLGKGWTMTCSKPIYNENNEMFGVICLDVSIENIKKKYFKDFTLGKTGKVYWLDENGNIFYHPDYETKAEQQGQVYEKNIFNVREISEDRKEVLKKALTEKRGMSNISEGTKEYILVYSKIPGTSSSLFIEMDNSEFIASNNFDASVIKALVVLDFLVVIIIAIVLFINFSKPMNQLIKSVNHVSNGDYSYIADTIGKYDTSIYEVEQLTKAFVTMSNSIGIYTDTLIEKNKEIGTILDTIEGAMMIVKLDGTIKIRTKSTEGISDEGLRKAIGIILESKGSFSEQVVINGQVYKNTYYPICSEQIEDIVVSSECITDSILMEKEIQQIEKMAGVGQLSAAIVHELKNTLALIKGATYILEISGERESSAKEIDTINNAVAEAETVIKTLLDYSKRDSSGHEMIHIGTIINQILLLSKKEIISKGIKIERFMEENIYLYSDGREALKVILQNIIINGIQAVGDDGKIQIRCVEKENIEISIKDNGGGICMNPAELVFEPFLTTKSSGTGIGLWITKRLTESLRGSIEVISDLENGTTEFVIKIPKK